MSAAVHIGVRTEPGTIAKTFLIIHGVIPGFGSGHLLLLRQATT
jgi:hypothetical protein